MPSSPPNDSLSQPCAPPFDDTSGAAHNDSGRRPEKAKPEPFPPFESSSAFVYNGSIPSLDTTSPPRTPGSAHLHSPVSGLRLQTEHLAQKNRHEGRSTDTASISESASSTFYNAGLPLRNSSIRSSRSAIARRRDSLSPASTSSSPAMGPLADMTPLPSPISNYGSPHRWRSSSDADGDDAPSEPQSTRNSLDSARGPLNFSRTSSKKRKVPILGRPSSDQMANSSNGNGPTYASNRSISEYVPEGVQPPRVRNVAVSTSVPSASDQKAQTHDDNMHREKCLAVQRGLVPTRLPTPPESSRGSKSDELERPSPSQASKHHDLPEYEATSIRSGKTKRWRAIRQLGEGQFSKVILATKEPLDSAIGLNANDFEKSLDPHSLVAVKICHHGPAGGADEKSVEVSIKRELNLMKSIDNPSLVHLKAVSTQDRQTLFVLHYCPGGDLFELASTRLELLTPSLVRRIFSELVGAVQYLHHKYIIHRDIKLENILVNMRPSDIASLNEWQTYKRPVVVLSDLGLGREIPQPPESPLLKRRCGSEDYAAPEVLIGQEYDGRSTDAWALGVVLYTLMEGRMPFDSVPGSRRRSPTSHKIARCEWQWVRYANADGEWDPEKGSALEGAREIVEGLLARTRTRWSLDKVQATEWVSKGIQVPGGIERGDEDL